MRRPFHVPIHLERPFVKADDDWRAKQTVGPARRALLTCSGGTGLTLQ